MSNTSTSMHENDMTLTLRHDALLQVTARWMRLGLILDIFDVGMLVAMFGVFWRPVVAQQLCDRKCSLELGLWPCYRSAYPGQINGRTSIIIARKPTYMSATLKLASVVDEHALA
jgi:hypothetical protein